MIYKIYKVNKHHKICKKAFTLAEVLITLGIIGVVAALTIPGLITNTQKRQTIELLKSTYSILKNAETFSEVDNGDSTTWDYTLSTSDFMNTYYAPYLKTLPMPTSRIQTKNTYTNINGGAADTNGCSWGYTAILANGVFLRVFENGQYIIMNVDLNGNNGPNVVGKDVFDFEAKWIGPKKLVVYAPISNRATYISQCQSWSYNGGSPIPCAGIIQLDGWQIASDYPW